MHLDESIGADQNAAPVLVTSPEFTGLRINLYRFLAGAYLHKPDSGFVNQLLDDDFIQQVGCLLDETVVAPLQTIPSSMTGEISIAHLQQEYTDLFVVPAGRYVTPFEDVYRGLRLDGKQERGPLLGNRAVTVKRLYAEAGADMDKTCKELPTHIGVELSFMQYLCKQEQAAATHSIDTGSDNVSDSDFSAVTIYRLWQLKFLHEHLTDWFPQLNKNIQKNANTAFYRGFACFTEQFLDYDKSMLQQQLMSELNTESAINTAGSKTV